jgi:hypothetical protein
MSKRPVKTDPNVALTPENSSTLQSMTKLVFVIQMQPPAILFIHWNLWQTIRVAANNNIIERGVDYLNFSP